MVVGQRKFVESKMKNEKCKICRRLLTKLFLKGEKCSTPKCPLIRKPYPPGFIGKRKKPPLSEYGKQLREKQKLKNLYNLNERQLKNYVKEILGRGLENPTDVLIKVLESRLDNIVFRLGFSPSRAQARQLVSHGFFLVNGKPVNFPSYLVKEGDIISLKKTKIKKNIFQDLKNFLKKQKIPDWLELNIENLEGKVKSLPSFEKLTIPVEISAIFEYYWH